MDDMDSNEYFTQKRALLRDCVSLSEEMLSNISDIVTINNVLLKREGKIRLLQNLDDHCDNAMIDSLSMNQKSQINQIVSLLLGLDRDVAKKIKVEQAELKNAMKVNTQNHKLINYMGKQAQTSGRLLDKKK